MFVGIFWNFGIFSLTFPGRGSCILESGLAAALSFRHRLGRPKNLSVLVVVVRTPTRLASSWGHCDDLSMACPCSWTWRFSWVWHCVEIFSNVGIFSFAFPGTRGSCISKSGLAAAAAFQHRPGLPKILSLLAVVVPSPTRRTSSWGRCDDLSMAFPCC